MLRLVVKLPDDRDFTGSLSLKDDDDLHLAGPFDVCGRSDDRAAARFGNVRRDRLVAFGDTPLGTYRVVRIIATGAARGIPTDRFGPHGVVVLEAQSGEAALADANGRFQLLIQGGSPGSGGRLRATNGSLRLAVSDQAILIQHLRRTPPGSVVVHIEEGPGQGGRIVTEEGCEDGDAIRGLSQQLDWEFGGINEMDSQGMTPLEAVPTRRRFTPLAKFRAFRAGAGGSGGGAGGDSGYGGGQGGESGPQDSGSPDESDAETPADTESSVDTTESPDATIEMTITAPGPQIEFPEGLPDPTTSDQAPEDYDPSSPNASEHSPNESLGPEGIQPNEVPDVEADEDVKESSAYPSDESDYPVSDSSDPKNPTTETPEVVPVSQDETQAPPQEEGIEPDYTIEKALAAVFAPEILAAGEELLAAGGAVLETVGEFLGLGSGVAEEAGVGISEKIAQQMVTRGWTEEQIAEAIESGEQFPAINKATGDAAIRYVHPETGQSVVVDSASNEVIHVGGPGFKYGPGSGDVP